MGLIEKAKQLVREFKIVNQNIDETRLLIGSQLAKSVSTAKSIREAEFKVFSQFGDDGIIQFLLTKIDIPVDKFVEFGVENYEESNTRFLLINNNWRGLIIDGSASHVEYIKKSSLYWRQDLTAVHSFITAENINQILETNGFAGKIGLLSVDIDGNDYWVWKAITVADADIVIVEYNSLFGADRAITVPYKPDFFRTNAHYSNLYFGASLPALYELALSKGYSFIGCNIAGNNAYFIKNNLVGDLPVQTVKEGFVAARFREARNANGELTFATEEIRRKEILGLPVVNVRTGLAEVI